MSAADYITEAGWALCKIPRGRKGGGSDDWQTEANAIRDPDAFKGWTGNVGLLHAWSRTAALDVDSYTLARPWLEVRGVDLDALLAADDAVQVRSGRPNRAKLLYRLPDGVELLETKKLESAGLELRCASSGGLTVQDVLPPSIHPDTGKPYEWGGAGDWRDLPELPPALLAAWRALFEVPRTSQERAASSYTEGGRNNQLTSLAGTMRRRGMSQTAIAAALHAENSEKCSPPLPTQEVDAIARSIAKKPATDATTAASRVSSSRPAVAFTPADQLKPGPIDWLLRGYLVQHTLAAIIAPPSSCKSFLAIDWACRVATGTPWFGKRAKKGAVFYLAGEGQRGLANRLAGWERHFGVSLAGAPLFVSAGIPALCAPGTPEAVREVIHAHAAELLAAGGVEPALIVVDTVARAMGGANENTQEDMGQFIQACDLLKDDWKATVLAVHHTGHTDQERGRGSSAFGGALDSDFFTVSKDRGPVTVKAGPKAKDWEAPGEVILARVVVDLGIVDDEGQPVTTLVLVDNTATLKAAMEADEKKREDVVAFYMRGRLAGKSDRAIAEEVEQLFKVKRSTQQRWVPPRGA